MSQTFQFRSYRKHIRTVDDVLLQMTDLDDELTGSTLHNLRPFNTTYKIITSGVKELLGTGYFQSDELMQALDVRFAHYFFSPLEAYVKGNRTPPAWKALFDTCPRNSLFQAIYMGLGVNAHVNNDLGQALFDVIPAESYLEDFLKVNRVIKDQTPLVISSLNEEGTIVNVGKNLMLPLYSFILQRTIESWRNYAWDVFLRLRNKTINIQEIEDHAQKIALKLMYVPKVGI